MPSANNHTPQQPSASTGMPVDDSNVEMEQGILGLILADASNPEINKDGTSGALAYLAENDATLRPEWFYRDAHHIIGDLAVELHAQGQLFDVIAFGDELARRGKLEAVGGLSYLSELMNHACLSEKQALRDARRMRDLWFVRVDHNFDDAIAKAYANHDRASVERLTREQAEHRANCTGKALAFPMFTLADLRALPQPEPLIPGMYMRGAHVVFYGDSDAGKSYYVQNLCYGLAQQGRHVVYVAAEGAAGLRLRMEAYLSLSGLAEDALDTFHVIPKAVQLFADDGADVALLCDQLRTMNPAPELVVFDTVARCSDGADENSNSDMRCVASAADAIREACGAALWAIHHDGKSNDKGPRGAQCLRNNADTVVKVTRDGGTSTVSCEKQKDGWERFKPVYFTLQHVALDAYDNDLGAYVLTLADGTPAEQDSGPKLTPRERQTSAALVAFYAREGRGASHTEWQTAATTYGVPAASFDKYRGFLMTKGLVEQDATTHQYVPTTQPGGKGGNLVEFQNFHRASDGSGKVEELEKAYRLSIPVLSASTSSASHSDSTHAPLSDVEQTYGAPERVMVPPSPGKPTPTSNGSVVVTVSDCRVARPADIPGRADTIAYLARELQEDDPTLTDADAFQRAQDEWTRYHE